MTTFQEQTGEAWIRSVNKRLAQLERLPHSVTASVAASELSAGTSASFEADVIMSSGTTSDVSLAMQDSEERYYSVTDDEGVLDPFLHEEYGEVPPEGQTDLSFAPVTPSDPLIEQRTGGVAVIWDGLGADGEAMPANMMLIEVHRSLSQDFDPDEATYCGSFLDAGVIVFADQEYEVQWWYRLLMLSMDGRRSTPTNAVEGTAQKVQSTEVAFSATDIDFDGAIQAAHAAAINAAARTNYSTNPNLAQHTGSVFAEWVGMVWIEDQFTATVDGGAAPDGLYPVIDGGTASSTFTETLDGGHA